MKNFILLIYIFFISIFSNNAFSFTHDEIMSKKEYKDTQNFINKFGKTNVLYYIVEKKKEDMKNYGSDIDKYTKTKNVYASNDTFNQINVIDLDNVLQDNKNNEKRKKEVSTKGNLIKYILSYQKEIYKKRINMMCSNPSSRALIDEGIKYTISFFDYDMNFIYSFHVDKDSCLKTTKY